MPKFSDIPHHLIREYLYVISGKLEEGREEEFKFSWVDHPFFKFDNSNNIEFFDYNSKKIVGKTRQPHTETKSNWQSVTFRDRQDGTVRFVNRKNDEVIWNDKKHNIIGGAQLNGMLFGHGTFRVVEGGKWLDLFINEADFDIEENERQYNKFLRRRIKMEPIDEIVNGNYFKLEDIPSTENLNTGDEFTEIYEEGAYFKFWDVQGAIEDLQSEALINGIEVYIRKDSRFFEWLLNTHPEWKNFFTAKKLFYYFGKLYRIR